MRSLEVHGASLEVDGAILGPAFLDAEPLTKIGSRQVLEALPVAIFVTDAAGRITFYNQAAAELAGREPELGRDRWCVTWRLFWPDGTPMPHDACPMAVALKDGRSEGPRRYWNGPTACACIFSLIRHRSSILPEISSVRSMCWSTSPIAS